VLAAIAPGACRAGARVKNKAAGYHNLCVGPMGSKQTEVCGENVVKPTSAAPVKMHAICAASLFRAINCVVVILPFTTSLFNAWLNVPVPFAFRMSDNDTVTCCFFVPLLWRAATAFFAYRVTYKLYGVCCAALPLHATAGCCGAVPEHHHPPPDCTGCAIP